MIQYLIFILLLLFGYFIMRIKKKLSNNKKIVYKKEYSFQTTYHGPSPGDLKNVKNRKEYSFQTTYHGPSPGDLKNVKNGFAGRFSGYCEEQKLPQTKIKFNNKKNVLIMGDSIIDGFTIKYIRECLEESFNVAFLNHPHHCKNIEYWLNEWKTDQWDYNIIFYFDGMHGFPNRVTAEEYKEYTPLLIKRLNKVCDLLIWGNLTPIPKDFPNGLSNSSNGPNTREQNVTDLAVIKRNESIKIVTSELDIPLIDLYSLMKPVLRITQENPKDLHFNELGQEIYGKYIAERINEEYNKYNLIYSKLTDEIKNSIHYCEYSILKEVLNGIFDKLDLDSITNVLEIGTSDGGVSTHIIYDYFYSKNHKINFYSYEGITDLFNVANKRWGNIKNVKIINKFFSNKECIKNITINDVKKSGDPNLNNYLKQYEKSLLNKNYESKINYKPDIIFIDSWRYSHSAIVKKCLEFSDESTLFIMEDDIENFGELKLLKERFNLINLVKIQKIENNWPYIIFNIKQKKL